MAQGLRCRFFRCSDSFIRSFLFPGVRYPIASANDFGLWIAQQFTFPSHGHGCYFVGDSAGRFMKTESARSNFSVEPTRATPGAFLVGSRFVRLRLRRSAQLGACCSRPRSPNVIARKRAFEA